MRVQKSYFSSLFKYLALAAFLSSSAWVQAAPTAQEKLHQAMLRNLETVQNSFEALYAPKLWKRDFASWSLDNEVAKAKAKVQANPKLSVKEYQKILWDLFNSTQDFHVGIGFHATEMATLPLSIRGAEGKYFLAYIDRTKLSKEAFPFEVGDEVTRFNARPISEEVAELRAHLGRNTQETIEALATLTLTRRRASRALPVPQGAVTLTVKVKGSDKESSRQLIWEYSPEQIDANVLPRDEVKTLGSSAPSSFDRIMMSSVAKDFADVNAIDPFTVGAKKSFVPTLGKTKIWEAGAEKVFDAYISLTEDRKLIGVIRIPSYVPSDVDAAVKEFAELVKHFESATDALVIDQVNNPGGSVFYLYTLASMLSPEPLRTPLHHMSITQADVAESYALLETVKDVKNDEDAQKLLGKTIQGYPVNYKFVEFMRYYARNTISDWKAGQFLSPPRHLWGADQIDPAPAPYTKPLLILVNELDFSGGDFFPAILQDNKRAVVMGTRTAGAGGYVLSQSFANIFGIEGFSLTGSLAKRVNDNPLENLGVTPDVPYSFSAKDFQENFAPYKKEIEAKLIEMLNTK